MVGKAEGQGAQEGYSSLQEIHCSEADECRYAEEVVGDDESTVGGEEGQDVALFCISRRIGFGSRQKLMRSDLCQPAKTYEK
jgi:hypothetical protein